MRTAVFLILVLFFTVDTTAQIIFRNDFVINGKRVKSLGVTTVTINLSRHPNLNQLINGRGGRTLVIDVPALRGRKKTFTYAEIAEKVYTPPVVTGIVTQKVPAFLLVDPRLIRPRSLFVPVQL